MFSKYVSTSEPNSKKGKYPPLVVKSAPYQTFLSLLEYLKNNGYEDIVAREEYYDLFAVKDTYEYSIVVVANEGNCFIQISVYKDSKFPKSKKHFRQIYEDIQEKFEN